jgi:hypothetical protein
LNRYERNLPSQPLLSPAGRWKKQVLRLNAIGHPMVPPLLYK